MRYIRPARSLIVLGLFLLVGFAAALPGAAFPPGDWYATLERPFYAPPNGVFGPVWTLLYVLIGVAGWRVWRQVGWQAQALAPWVTQLLLNALWTPLFFGLHWLGIALIEMTLLGLAILWCIAVFRHIDRAAAWMLLPYLAWVGFAWLLNAGFWWLNR